MSFQSLQRTAILAWLVLVFLVASITALVGGPIASGTAFLFLAVAILPTAILLVVFRGAPPKSINQVLYDEEQAPVRVPSLAPGRKRRDGS